MAALAAAVVPLRLAAGLGLCSRLLSRRGSFLGSDVTPFMPPTSLAKNGSVRNGVVPRRPGRRVHTTALAAAAAGPGRETETGAGATSSGTAGPYKLPDLPYDYNALEPFIDTATMRAHHDGHHATYVSKLNEAIQDKGHLTGATLHQLQKAAIKSGAAVRNNAGGHYNHSLFWTYMAPRGMAAREPSGKLKDAIGETFGSFEKFQTLFNGACAGVFGSGWVWLGVAEDGRLSIETTANQDNPLMEGVVLSKNTASGDRVAHTGGRSSIIPFMGQDVWEHAYYLKYQNKKVEYFSAWWNVLNWDKICEYYEKYAAKGQYIPVEM
ncbi:hypothetical protein CBR_g32597 [Chara braunii]|uniref:superoxide dismutase n=1 Tax=Chara braunii TaxID=69332 RepID=A0A388LH81_CHABU|nr:hypothetical protein CBR_g32597 [Chara braunii]|eukprot:GBG81605.1 hypothetical protein CBR_g32597 [Chara braunii]